MSVTPHEIMTKLQDSERIFLTEIEKKIDQFLWKNYKGGSAEYWLTSPELSMATQPRVWVKIKELYPDWEISSKWSEDPRDSGGCIIFQEARKVPDIPNRNRNYPGFD